MPHATRTSPRRLPSPRSRVIAAVAALCLIAPAVLAPTAAAQDTGSAASPGAELVQQSLAPSPSPDPWYRLPAPEESIAPGTVLDSREVTIPPTAIAVPNRAWQLRVRSSDSHGRPIAVLTTVVVPRVPWTGGGPRPLVSLNQPIDSLGLHCNPSWTMLHSPQPETQPLPVAMLTRGWALTIPDHEGPQMAYAAGRLAGHAVLDSVRATRAFAPAGLADSAVQLNGYSGGAIATGWAAQLQPSYAPELGGALVGAVAGGTPADPALLFDTLDGTVGSGFFRAALVGISREYAALNPLFNRIGVAVAAPLRDACADAVGRAGLLALPSSALAAIPDVRRDPDVAQVLRANTLGESAPTTPVLLYHGSASVGIGDEFIPESGALRLRSQWCAQGAHVDYQPVFGGHVLAPWTAMSPTLRWMDDRFAGRPPGPGCRG